MLATTFAVVGITYGQVADAVVNDTDGNLNPLGTTEGDGPRYVVGNLQLRYVGRRDEAPSISRLMQHEVLIGLGKTGYVAPQADVEILRRTLEEIAFRPPEPYHGSAIRAIAEQVRRHLKDRYRIDATVRPDPSQIDGVGDDLRRKGDTALRLNIAMGGVPAVTLDKVPETTVSRKVEASDIDGPVYEIGELKVHYLQSRPGLPTTDQLMKIPVTLGVGKGGYIAPRKGVPVVNRHLEDMAYRPVEPYYASAIQTILEAVRDNLTDRGFMGVYVAPDPVQIDESGNDLRPAGQSAFQILVTLGMVTELRTVAAGDRIPSEERINHPVHERIREHSPIQTRQHVEETDDSSQSSVLNREVLDDYVYQLSRHPGRRVDVAVSTAEDPGGIALDYIITENKPWSIFAQLSNTGTSQTGQWQQRFGYYHNQLTNNDDRLNIQYLTAGFNDVHAVAGSYEFPLFDFDRLRLRLASSWSEYTASDVGFFNDTFTGESYELDAGISANIYQDKFFFVDLTGGVKYLDIEVANTLPGSVAASENFIIPYIGLAMEQQTEWFSTFGNIQLEWQSSALNNVDRGQLDNLGRNSPEDDWIVLSWDLGHSVYLEPLLFREAWNDPTTPESSTLAHELFFAFKGQYAFDYRLIPQVMQVLGGQYTVRGYPESVVAADTVLIGKLEYRFHLPRLFPVEPQPAQLFGEPFRWAPQYVYGRPDWDLAFRGFADIGHATSNGRGAIPAEPDDTLVGSGIGLDLTYKRNLRLGLDWGFALKDTEDGKVKAGSNRIHVLVTVLY